MDTKIKEYEMQLGSDLKLFFDKINQDNTYLAEKYDELIDLLRKYSILINDKDRVIHLYSYFYKEYELDDWQLSLYEDIGNRLIGLCPDFKRIDL